MSGDFLFKRQYIPIIGILLLLVGLTLLALLRDELTPISETTIQYEAPTAAQAWLVWGVNGWRRLPSAQRPAGTEITEDGVMRTPMARQGDRFVIDLPLQGTTAVDFGVSVDYPVDERTINVWDSDGGKNYRINAPRTLPFEMQPTTYPDSQRVEAGMPVEQVISYAAADADSVTLVWTFDGTVDSQDRTLMQRENGVFTAVLPLTAGTELDYYFEVEQDGTTRFDTNLDDQNYSTLIQLQQPIVIASVLDDDGETAVSATAATLAHQIRLGAAAAFLLLTLGWIGLSLFRQERTMGADQLHIVSPFSSKRFWTGSLVLGVLTLFMLFVYLQSFEFYGRYDNEWDAMPTLKYLFLQFDPTSDGVFVAWYLATVLILISGVSSICFIVDWQLHSTARKRLVNSGWLGLSLLSFGLSILALTPSLMSSVVKGLLAQSAPYLVGVGAPLLICGGLLLLLLLRLVRGFPLIFLLLLGGIGGVAMPLIAQLAASLLSFDLASLPLPLLVLIDSGMVLGVFGLLTAVSRYGQLASDQLTERVRTPIFSLNTRTVFIAVVLLSTSLRYLLFINPLIASTASLLSWLIVVFGAAITAVAIQIRTQTETDEPIIRNMYGLFAGISVLLSFYLSSLEAAWFVQLSTQLLNLTLLFQIVMGLLLLFIVYVWFVFIPQWRTRLLLLATLLFAVGALFSSLPAAVTLRYFGMTLLLFALLAQMTHWKPRIVRVG